MKTKTKNPRRNPATRIEHLLTRSAGRYQLRLYVTGTTPQSTLAITNLKEVCEAHLKGRYDLEVVDLYQQPELARGREILVAPTLVKQLPVPVRRLIGDLSNRRKVLLALDVPVER